MMQCFDAALWLTWPAPMPEYVGYEEAPTAFAAVEGLMRVHDLVFVAYACARALDGSLIYRCHKLLLETEKEGCS